MRKKRKSNPIIKRIFIIADSIVFTVLILLLLRPFMRSSAQKWLFIPIGAGVFGVILLIRFKLKNIRQVREREAQIKQQSVDRLLLCEDESLSQILGHSRFILIRNEHPERTDIMEAIRRNADAVGFLSQKTEYAYLIDMYSPDMKIYSIDDLLRLIFHQNEKRSDGRVHIRRPLIHMNKYCILGILLFAVSFFFKSKIYYRMISCICLIFALVSGIFAGRGRHNKFPIFLDNINE